jgi:hypothetical protein
MSGVAKILHTCQKAAVTIIPLFCTSIGKYDTLGKSSQNYLRINLFLVNQLTRKYTFLVKTFHPKNLCYEKNHCLVFYLNDFV